MHLDFVSFFNFSLQGRQISAELSPLDCCASENTPAPIHSADSTDKQGDPCIPVTSQYMCANQGTENAVVSNSIIRTVLNKATSSPSEQKMWEVL